MSAICNNLLYSNTEPVYARFIGDIGKLPMNPRLQQYFKTPLDKLVTKFTVSEVTSKGELIERKLNAPLIRGGKNGRAHIMTVHMGVPKELVHIMNDFRKREFEFEYRTMSINHTDHRILTKKRKIDIGHVVILLNYFQEYWLRRGNHKRIPLSTYLLEKNFGDMTDYGAFLKRWLQQNGYIEISVRPVIGEYVTCYKLTQKFMDIEWVDMEYNVYMYSDEMVNNINCKVNVLGNKNVGVYLNLAEDLNKIDISEEEAKKIVKKLKKDSKVHAEAVIRQFKLGRIRYSVDKNGRMYTPFTNMKTEIRDRAIFTKNSLREGRPDKFVSCDLKSSQMFMLGREMLDSIRNYTPVDIKNEFMEWYQMCKDGTIYDSVPNFNILISDNCKDRRDAMKKMFFNCIFGDGYTWRELHDIFEMRWKHVGDFLRERKVMDYRVVAGRLQKREADIIIGEICREMKEQYPNVPIFTVHDQIYFPESSRKTHIDIFEKICDKYDLAYTYNKIKNLHPDRELVFI